MRSNWSDNIMKFFHCSYCWLDHIICGNMCAVSSGMIVYVTSTLHGRICTYLVHIVRTSQGFCMCLCVHISNSQTTYERKKDNNSRKTKFLVCFVSRRKPRSCSSAPASSLSSASSSSLPLCAGLLLLCCSAAAVWSRLHLHLRLHFRLHLRLHLRLKTKIVVFIFVLIVGVLL